MAGQRIWASRKEYREKFDVVSRAVAPLNILE